MNNNKINNIINKKTSLLQKGAMFGMDARVALFIMSVLTVMGGAFVQQMIVKSKATALLVELEDIGKAYNSYVYDTRETLALPAYVYSIDDLVENVNNYDRWKGPYLYYDLLGLTQLDHPEYAAIMLFNRNTAAWGGVTGVEENVTTEGLCTGEECRVFAAITNIDRLDIVNKVDEVVDGELNPRMGKVRTWDNNDGTYNIYLEVGVDPFQ